MVFTIDNYGDGANCLQKLLEGFGQSEKRYPGGIVVVTKVIDIGSQIVKAKNLR